MKLLDGLHAIKVVWLRREKRFGLMVISYEAPMLAWRPGSESDEMWLAITEVEHSQWKAEQLVREVA